MPCVLFDAFLMLQSEILASFNLTRSFMVSHGLENNNTLKRCFDNFPTYMTHISGLLENCRINISMYRCSIIKYTMC